jgi:hypothetical protein
MWRNESVISSTYLKTSETSLMQLDDWVTLSSEERRSRSECWRNQAIPGVSQPAQETEWMALVREAAARFAYLYGHLPEVLHVGYSQSFHAQQPISIGVSTRLPREEKLAQLPNEFATFPVIQEAVADDIEGFKATWATVLERLFNWDKSAIADFVAGQERLWHSPFFLHDPPRKYLPKWELARSALKSWHRYDEAELFQIGEQLARAVGGRFYLHKESDYDWNAARDRVSQIIQTYDRV